MKIKVSLDKRSISKAIKELNNYKVDLERKTQMIVIRLANEGYSCVVKNLANIRYSGSLQNSVGLSISKNYAMVYVSSEHAVFVEFGTGSKGAESPYTGVTDINYQYNIGETIGWYNVKGEMKYGWFYYDELKKKVIFTEGMPSRPFMWNASQTLRYQKLNEIIREVFR